jgi:plasmid maintenance system antidote protein VapI
MTAAEIRAELRRRRVFIYEAAAAVQLNPCRLSQVLNEHIALSPHLALRLQRFLDRVDRDTVGMGQNR